MTDLTVMGTKAKAAARECGKTGTNDKNEVLKAVADALLKMNLQLQKPINAT